MSYAAADSFNPFVVFGSAKSGTTWLQQILDAHPQIRCHFQLPIFPLRDARLWYNAPIVWNKNNSPFVDVFDDEGEHERYTLAKTYLENLGINRRDYLDTIGIPANSTERPYFEELNRRVLREVTQIILCDRPDKQIFGTKSYLDLDLLYEAFPDARFIHIVRDGRDVSVSKRFHLWRSGVYYHGDEINPALYWLNERPFTRQVTARMRQRFGWFGESWFHSPKDGRPLFSPPLLTKIALDWKLIVCYLLEQQGRHRERALLVRYEDLLTNPQQEIKRVVSFLGANADDEIVASLASATDFGALKNKGEGKFFRKGTRGDWRNHFTEQDVRLFKELAGDVLIRLGYESSNNWSDGQPSN